jgi:hypothetical protein
VRKNNLRFFIISSVLLCLLVLFTPLEKTLGANSRLVYLHGALVWVAIIMFMVAGLAGLYGLIVRREHIHMWSRATGHVHCSYGSSSYLITAGDASHLEWFVFR